MQPSLLLLAVFLTLVPIISVTATNPQTCEASNTCSEHEIKLRTLKEVDDAANIPLDEEDMITGTVCIEFRFWWTWSQGGIGQQKHI